MVIVTKTLKVQLQRPDQPVDYFLNVHNKIRHFTKNTCFIRFIGMDGTEEEYIELIRQIDSQLSAAQAGVGYLRLQRLSVCTDIKRIEAYGKLYEDYCIGSQNIPQLSNIQFPYTFSNEMLNLTQKKAFGTVLKLFETTHTNGTSSMIKNFAVKLLYWIQVYMPELWKDKQYGKVVYAGSIKLQEFLFLYFLVLMGCEVLYLNPQCDAEIGSESVKELAYLYKAPNLSECKVPIPEFTAPKKESVHQTSDSIEGKLPASYEVASTKVDIQRREPKQSHQVNVSDSVSLQRLETIKPAPQVIIPERKRSGTPRRELEYEEIARMAAAVVMIKAYDKNRECFKTGSGVVINRKGYILTNFHVASQTAYYGIRFENEEEEHLTDSMVKYHDSNDLALLRVDKYSMPLEVYQGPDIVRGQKVVAIGSPLGLFNTVSDGIISGFRNIDDVAMIQFTAPISHGSSGGALLDKYGRLIGLLTGGYNDGQNLNLAVSYQVLYDFIRGFIT